LLQKLDFPLAAPSANPFGYVSPTCASHVANQLGGKIEYILDGGECSIGIESTIVGRIEGKLVVFRLGGLSLEEIEDLSMEKVAEVRRSSSKPDAPGMLSLHYAPYCKLYVLESPIPLAQNIDTERTAWLGFGTLPDTFSNKAKVLWLSKSGDTNEAARNVFRVLRQLDEQGFQRAHVQLLPEEGLGRAVNDRLIRAAAKRN
jgi:L-threonylcarbamoyladenylate synthase